MAKPKKVDEVAKLSEEMLRVLTSRRDLGGEAYPPTLRQLAEFCDGSPSDDQVVKAATKALFTKAAVATERVAKTPALDSPVYFKQDVPKPDAVLARRMVLVLEAQRLLGGDAYPPTLRRLAELCERNASDTLVPKAAAHESMSSRAVVAAKMKGKPNLDAPVFLEEDLRDSISSILPALFRFALRPATSGKTPVETHAFPAPELPKRFVEAVQEAFSDALRRGIETGVLPPDVAWIRIKGEPHLFLLENLRTGSGRRSFPAADHAVPPAVASNGTATAPASDFAEAFRAAFERLDRRNGSTNFVKLSELRRALPEFGREEFDAELRRIRLDGQFALDSHEGLHGSLTPDEREAGVREAGSLLIYASRR